MVQPEVQVKRTRGEEPLRSEHYVVQTMPSILGTFDMTATFLVVMLWIVIAATAAGGGAAAFTYLILGAVTFFIPCVVATAQLAHMFPHEGSLYNWTHKALGGYWSFFCGFCAWFPAVFLLISGVDIGITIIQGLHSTWLTEPWQQGLAIIAILAFSGIFAVQPFRMVQHVVNAIVVLLALPVVLIGLSGVVWLLTGHASVTNFTNLDKWNISWDPMHGNIYLFGLITMAYIGTEVPLSMGGEIRHRKVATRHLLWAALLVPAGYFVTTASLLVVQGPSVSSVGAISLVTNVQMVLGTFAGKIVAVCLLSFYVVAVPVVYNYVFARLLMVGGIDGRLPHRISRLNRNLVPARAIFFQTVIAIICVVLAFLVIPYLFNLDKPANLANEMYNVSLAGATLVWAISTIFMFVNIVLLYFHDPKSFHRQRIFPMPVLVATVIIGPIACLMAIVDSLFFSWIPQIDNAHWWYIVGGLTVVCLLVASIGSMLANSEASWQVLEEGVNQSV
jgi:amino acid transporter